MNFVFIQLFSVFCFLMLIRAERLQQQQHGAHPHHLVTFKKVSRLNGEVSYKEVSSKQVLSGPTAPSYKYENTRQQKLTNPLKEQQNRRFFQEDKQKTNSPAGKKKKQNIHVTKFVTGDKNTLHKSASSLLFNIVETYFQTMSSKVMKVRRVDDIISSLTSSSLPDVASVMLVTLAIVSLILHI